MLVPLVHAMTGAQVESYFGSGGGGSALGEEEAAAEDQLVGGGGLRLGQLVDTVGGVRYDC